MADFGTKVLEIDGERKSRSTHENIGLCSIRPVESEDLWSEELPVRTTVQQHDLSCSSSPRIDTSMLLHTPTVDLVLEHFQDAAWQRNHRSHDCCYRELDASRG